MIANPINYGAAVASMPVSVNPTDVFMIGASATKRVRILKLLVSGTATTAVSTDVVIIKRTTLNTGGSPVILSPISFESNNPPATAIVTTFPTSNPVLGTPNGTTGIIGARKLIATTNSNPSVANIPVEFNYFSYVSFNGISLLKGSTECVCANLNGFAIAGGLFFIECWWSEE